MYMLNKSLKTGALGFEPRNGGTKNRCLTTWRRPNALSMSTTIADLPLGLSTFFFLFLWGGACYLKAMQLDSEDKSA